MPILLEYSINILRFKIANYADWTSFVEVEPQREVCQRIKRLVVGVGCDSNNVETLD